MDVSAEVILEAIARSPDITRRGIRGVLAQAACKTEIIDQLEGWLDVTPDGHFPFDFRIELEHQSVTIQVKLQRKRQGRPMRADEASGLNDREQFVVETQRTRAGVNLRTGEDTRPYRFVDFDILGVCMEPSTKGWSDFRFTPARWLIPRTDVRLMAKYQPVSLEINDDWTDSLPVCVSWLQSGAQKTIRGGGPRPPRQRSPD